MDVSLVCDPDWLSVTHAERRQTPNAERRTPNAERRQA
jgi:hypothetical protein